MKKGPKHHITELEERVLQLSEAMMQDGKTLDERNRLESELRVAQQALEHYQQAITLEAQLSRQ